MIRLLVIIVLCVIGYKVLKPYFIKYDNAVIFTGSLGSGKTFNSVVEALKRYKVVRRKTIVRNFFRKKLNKFRKNKKDLIEMPLLISNVPIYSQFLFGKKKFVSYELTKEMLTLQARIPEHSVVVIDEISNIVNQFNWNIEEVQYHLNEFVQFFRHYTGGYLILNAQADSEVVKQVRVKLNSEYICFNWRKILFIYKVDVLHRLIMSDGDTNSSNFIDDDFKTRWGFLFFKHYDSRYLSERYKKVPYKDFVKHKDNKVKKLIRFKDYKSRCD